MRNIFKSAAVATVLMGLTAVIGLIATARPAFAESAEAAETVAQIDIFDNIEFNGPVPTPGAAALFLAGAALIATAGRKFAK